MNPDQEVGTLIEGDLDVGGDLVLGKGDPVEPTFVLLHDNGPLVKVWIDTGKVEILREPEDETIRQASRVFWESIETYGGTLCRRVKTLNDLLTEVREMIPGPDVMSGLRAFSRQEKEKLAERIDELLESNRTFIEEADRRSIFDHGEEHQEGGQGEG